MLFFECENPLFAQKKCAVHLKRAWKFVESVVPFCEMCYIEIKS